MALIEFIGLLRQLQQSQNICFSVVKHPDLLFSSLDELNSMIGMTQVKTNIIKLIKTLVIKKFRKVTAVKKDKMLHCLLLGSPGTGKTVLGSIICKIYISLNMLTVPAVMPPEEDKCEGGPILLVVGLQNKRLCDINRKLSRQQYETNNFINRLEACRTRTIRANCNPADINHFISTARDLKRKLIDINTETIPLLPTPLLPLLPNNTPLLNYKVCSRADLVGGYLGQSALKTRKLLNSTLGGVLFIDEAYELFQSYSDGDPYGGEALAVIIEYMTKYNENIAIIFAGYSEAIKNSILKGQEGLKSRIGYTYHINSYTSSELADILALQFNRNGSVVAYQKQWLITMLHKYKTIITNARDTQNLVSKCEDAHSTMTFEVLLQGESINFDINKDMMIIGLEDMKIMDNTLSKKKGSLPPPHMYT
jgi:hypothetical protein